MRSKNYYQKFLNHVKHNWKTILFNYAVLILIFGILLLIDQLTKTYLFHHGNVFTLDAQGFFELPDGSRGQPSDIYPLDPSKWADYKIIGFRSVWHNGVTLLKNPNFELIQGLSVLIVLFAFVVPLFMVNGYRKTLIAFLAIVSAGAMGNALDRFIFNNHVKDIFYLPFFDRGTFNFADVAIIVGMALIIIYLVIATIKDWKKETKEEQEQAKEDTKMIAQIKAADQKIEFLTNAKIKVNRRNSKMLISRRSSKISNHKKL